ELAARLGQVVLADDNAQFFQRLEGAGDARAGDAGAAVEHGAVAADDALGYLREADGVAVLAEAVRAAGDVEEDLELGAREFGHPEIEHHVGDLRAVGDERPGHSPPCHSLFDFLSRSVGTTSSPALPRRAKSIRSASVTSSCLRTRSGQERC